MYLLIGEGATARGDAGGCSIGDGHRGELVAPAAPGSCKFTGGGRGDAVGFRRPGPEGWGAAVAPATTTAAAAAFCCCCWTSCRIKNLKMEDSGSKGLRHGYEWS